MKRRTIDDIRRGIRQKEDEDTMFGERLCGWDEEEHDLWKELRDAEDAQNKE